jgi:predicted nucleic acid-binding protein
MKYLGDADLVIDHFHHQPTVSRVMPDLLAEGLALSAVTLIELYEGVYFGRDARGAERDLRQFIRGVTVLPLNRRVIRRTAHVRGALRARRAQLLHRAYDVIAAATALEYDLTLVSSNAKDFRDIPDLRFLNARTPATGA